MYLFEAHMKLKIKPKENIQKLTSIQIVLSQSNPKSINIAQRPKAYKQAQVLYIPTMKIKEKYYPYSLGIIG